MVWLFDGTPDEIGLNVQDASPVDGGYVVVFELENREVRMMATRFPAKYIASWRSNTRRYGGEELKRVLVSAPHPRYERLKKMLAANMASEAGPGGKPSEPSIDLVLRKAQQLFGVTTPHPIHELSHSVGHEGVC